MRECLWLNEEADWVSDEFAQVSQDPVGLQKQPTWLDDELVSLSGIPAVEN